MANQEQVQMLINSVEQWNQWRLRNSAVFPDLIDAHLSDAHLANAYLSDTSLFYANLNSANLSYADLSNAHLSFSKLISADLSHTTLHYADLIGTNLYGANLSYANMGDTILNDLDLRNVKGLELVTHYGSSGITTSTLERSHGNIPEAFLHGVGLNNTSISYARSLKNNLIEYYTCFISYSSQDQDFAERIYADLQSKGVRCWYAPKDLKIGDKFWHRIDDSIRLYDKLLVVLSQHSIRSNWVEREMTTALEKEDRQNKEVLFPIRLDIEVMDTSSPWASDLRRQRHIGDFTQWKDHDSYQKSFMRLLRDLNKPSTPHE